MWPKDSGSWGVFLAILALVLTVPLSIIGNILTPKFQNWWARRSRLGLEQRINSLRTELAELSKYPLLSDTEEFILINGQVTQAIILALGYLLLGITFMVENSQAKIVAFVGFVGLIVFAGFFAHPVYRYRRQRSPMSRNKLTRQIQELESDLKNKVSPSQ